MAMVSQIKKCPKKIPLFSSTFSDFISLFSLFLLFHKTILISNSYIFINYVAILLWLLSRGLPQMTSMLDNLCIFAKRLRFIRQNTLFLKLMQEKVPKKKAYPVLCFLVPVQDKTTGSHHFHYNILQCTYTCHSEQG